MRLGNGPEVNTDLHTELLTRSSYLLVSCHNPSLHPVLVTDSFFPGSLLAHRYKSDSPVLTGVRIRLGRYIIVVVLIICLFFGILLVVIALTKTGTGSIAPKSLRYFFYFILSRLLQ